MPAVVVTIRGEADPSVKGLVVGIVGRRVKVSVLKGAARRLLRKQHDLVGEELSLRFHSHGWRDSPLLGGQIAAIDQREESLELSVELRDWGELARYWGRELHWMQEHPSHDSDT